MPRSKAREKQVAEQRKRERNSKILFIGGSRNGQIHSVDNLDAKIVLPKRPAMYELIGNFGQGADQFDVYHLVKLSSASYLGTEITHLYATHPGKALFLLLRAYFNSKGEPTP